MSSFQNRIVGIAQEHTGHTCAVVMCIVFSFLGAAALVLNASHNNWKLTAPILGNCDCDSKYDARNGSVIGGIVLLVLAVLLCCGVVMSNV